MVSALLNLWISFLAGLFAPLGAVCVLPLYPGFLSYLAGQVNAQGTESENKKQIIMFGVIITLGVIVSMFVFGLIFTFFLQGSLTKAIGIISPIAFGILAVISLFSTLI
jgi:cytochrome c-type biogenesis protein